MVWVKLTPKRYADGSLLLIDSLINSYVFLIVVRQTWHQCCADQPFALQTANRGQRYRWIINEFWLNELIKWNEVDKDKLVLVHSNEIDSMNRVAVWCENARHRRWFHRRPWDLRQDRRTVAGSWCGCPGQQRWYVIHPSGILSQHSGRRGILHASDALQHSFCDGHDAPAPAQNGGETQRTHPQRFICLGRPSNTAPFHVFQL